jgi:hypothetical protein
MEQNMKYRSTFTRLALLTFLVVLVLAGCTSDDSTSEPAPTSVAQQETFQENQTDVQDAMQLIEERVSDLRDLEILQPVTKSFMTTEELRERIEQEFEEEYSPEEARQDALLYAAFDLMEQDTDLYRLLIDLQTEQVAGFYDPDTQEMYVIKSGESDFGALEKSVFSHEFVHALQDQHFDLQALGFTNEEVESEVEEDSEKDFAVRSLVEGDASLLQQQYLLQHFEMQELQEMMAAVQETDTSIMDSVPAVLRETLLFPYEAGLFFVTALHGEGGWAAVDDAYENLPVSTEQIIHPDRYPGDVPIKVTLPPLTDTLGSRWQIIDESVLGEFGLDLYLDVYLSSDDAQEAADGWGGDRYTVHWRDDESAFALVLRSAWDTPEDADEFFQAYSEFATERFNGAQPQRDKERHLWWSGQDTLLLTRNDQGETLVVIAPDEPTVQKIYALFPEFQ